MRYIHGLKISSAIVALLCGTATAQLPQPDMILYGQVINGSNVVTEGTLEWTFERLDGGPPVVVSTDLTPISGTETLSYSVQVPVSFPIGESGALPGSLPLSDTSLRLNRSATLNGEPVYISMSLFGNSLALNLEEHLGLAERVDLEIVDMTNCCPGDASRDGFVTIADYSAVRNHFGDPTPTLGDASCDSFVNLTDYLAVRDRLGSSCEDESTRRRRNYTIATAATEPSAIFSIEGGTTSAQGEPYRLSVSVDAAEPLGVCTVFLKYDPEKLQFSGGSSQTALFDSTITTANPRLVAPGFIAISSGSNSGISGEGLEVATVDFIPLSKGQASISIVSDGPFAAAALDPDMNVAQTGISAGSVDLQVEASTRITDWMNFQ